MPVEGHRRTNRPAGKRDGASPPLRRMPSADAGRRPREKNQTVRSTIIFLISAMALAGFRFFGQVLAQFMIVWQR